MCGVSDLVGMVLARSVGFEASVPLTTLISTSLNFKPVNLFYSPTNNQNNVPSTLLFYDTHTRCATVLYEVRRLICYVLIRGIM